MRIVLIGAGSVEFTRNLLGDITFNTRVLSATFDEHTGLWSVATDTGENVQTPSPLGGTPWLVPLFTPSSV